MAAETPREDDRTLAEWANTPHDTLGFSQRQIEVQALLAEVLSLSEAVTRAERLEADLARAEGELADAIDHIDGLGTEYEAAEAQVRLLAEALREINELPEGSECGEAQRISYESLRDAS